MEIKQATRTPLKRVNTLNPDPNKSLFKYQLKWADTGINQPKTFYSFDKIEERGLFCEGISKELRLCWRKFLDEIPDDCLQFFGNCYPQELKDIHADSLILIDIHYINLPTNNELINYLSKVYGESNYIRKALLESGLAYRKLVKIDPSSKEPKPSHCPKYHKDVATFNGLVAGKRWYINPKNKFKERGLLEVQVYDNLCYHSDNLVGIWTRDDLFLL
ncbi:MAG: hypothetical protein U0Y10_01975 [Spirosomataceae bacterium]